MSDFPDKLPGWTTHPCDPVPAYSKTISYTNRNDQVRKAQFAIRLDDARDPSAGVRLDYWDGFMWTAMSSTVYRTPKAARRAFGGFCSGELCKWLKKRRY
jgi:uncharacterized protein YcnI